MAAKENTLNLDVLNTLKELDDGTFFGELVKLFLDNIPHLLQSISVAIASKEQKAMHLAAHKLKGSCGNIGAEHMADLASALEGTQRRELVSHDPQLILAMLEEEFVKVTAALQHEVRLQIMRHSNGVKDVSQNRLH